MLPVSRNPVSRETKTADLLRAAAARGSVGTSRCCRFKRGCFLLLWSLCASVLPGIARAQVPSPEIDNNLQASQAAPHQTALPRPAIGRRESFPRAFRKDLPESVEDLKHMEAHVEYLLARVSRAVVSVAIGTSSGSAVIVSPDGVVLTAAHVCGRPGLPVEFTFPDGKTARGVTLGTHHAIDAGMMKIIDPGPWPFVPLGELDAARAGDWVMALGHPGGFDAERPVVLRLGRIITLLPEVMQTDCTLIMGDSGGPLFDMHGRVVAIHSRISDSADANYHVPITTYLDTWERLANSEDWGAVRPPRPLTLGATGEDHTEGCKVLTVAEAGRAARAGFKPGDIVLKVNGQSVQSWTGFVRTLMRATPGTDLPVLIRRDGAELTLQYRAAGRGPGRGGARP